MFQPSVVQLIVKDNYIFFSFNVKRVSQDMLSK